MYKSRTTNVCSSSSSIHQVATIFLLLALLHSLLLWFQEISNCPTQHENSHLAAGLSHLKYQRFDLFRVNPPLIRVIAAVPTAVLHHEEDWRGYSMQGTRRGEWLIGHDFAESNGARTCQLVTYARLTLIPLSVFGLWLCGHWTTRLYGPAPGILAMCLWCFSPFMLGHESMITADAHAATFSVLAMYAYWNWLRTPEQSCTLLVGLLLGLAELCKFTLLIFYPLLPLLWFAYRLPELKSMGLRDWTRQAAMLLVALLVSLCVINCGYMFEDSFTPLEDFRFQSLLFTGQDAMEDVPSEGGNRFAGTWAGNLPMPLPANMLQGIDTQRYDFERGLPSYLRGQWANHGWWYYYLYALVIKVPLGTWGLVGLAIVLTIFVRSYSASWRDEMVVLAPGVAILVFVSSQTGFSVHSRYILPALPFLFVWVSKVGRVFESPVRSLFARMQKRRQQLTQRREGAKGLRAFAPSRLCVNLFSMRGLVVLLLAWSVISSMSIYPHSLSYFNELAALLPTPADATYPTPVGKSNESILSAIINTGPRNGPRHLLDSNIDWGQDLFYLEDWRESHPEARPIKVAYFGSYPLDKSKIVSAGLPPVGVGKEQIDDNMDTAAFGPLPGWYALSVNYIYSRSQQYRYFLNFRPVAMAGYSIYIYHITLDEANRVRRELGLPELKTEAGTRTAED